MVKFCQGFLTRDRRIHPSVLRQGVLLALGDRRSARRILMRLAVIFIVSAFPVNNPVFGQQSANAATTATLQQGNGFHAGEFTVPVNKSQILKLDVPFKDLSIGNAKIADVLALSDRTIYVLGKSIGSTSLTIFGENRKLIAVADVVVTYDVQGLKERLYQLLPKEKIEVRPAGGTLILTGEVSSADVAHQAMSIADTFAPGKVKNMLRVRGRQQVMLSVRFAEVQRNAVKALGLNVAGLFNSGNNVIGVRSFQSNGASTFPGATLGTIVAGANIVSGNWTLTAIFDALENKGVVKTLAEPNLIALSGDTADFLAGGEFPYRVINKNGDIGVEFKKFGVSLAFTPTILDSNRINMVVAPEVSRIDTTIDASAGAALSVRRASTTVELGDGQSFAIAGLLQNDFDDNISQVPWIGDVPVLGSLFRSSQFRKKQTELVIVVTPHIVRPISGRPALPTDKFIPPSDEQLFYMGKTEAHSSSSRTNSLRNGATGGGGLTGPRGHILK